MSKIAQQSSKRYGLFVDGSNLYASAQALDFRVDFTKLLNYYKGMGDVAHAMYFTALPPKNIVSPLRRMIDYVEYNGWIVIQKETRNYIDREGQSKLKGNMDVEIAVHVNEVVSTITDMVLFSGDGDFCCLLESVRRRHGVHCTVVSSKGLVSDQLRRQANEFVDLASLRGVISQEDTVSPTVRAKRFKFISS